MSPSRLRRELSRTVKRGEVMGIPSTEFIPSRVEGLPSALLRTGRAGKAERLFGFKAKTPFEEGLRRTIRWYVEQHGIAIGQEVVTA